MAALDQRELVSLASDIHTSRVGLYYSTIRLTQSLWQLALGTRGLFLTTRIDC